MSDLKRNNTENHLPKPYSSFNFRIRANLSKFEAEAAVVLYDSIADQ